MGITRYLGIAEEQDYGVKVEAREFIDPESAELDPEGEDKLIYEGMSGIDRVAAPGPYSIGGELTVPLDHKVSPWFFKWALGSVETSGDEAPYTHTIKPAQDPLMKSFTARIGKDIMEHVFHGCVATSLNIEAENEWVQMTVGVAGAKDSKDSLDQPVTFTEGNIFAAHQVEMELNSTNETAKVESFSLNIETGADVESAIGPGSRFPKRGYRGGLVVDLELSLGFENLDELERFWGSSDGPSQSLEDFGATIYIGSDIEITLPKLVYTGMTQPVGGRERIEQTATARALVNGDGDGPVMIKVTNDIESYN
ncbi:phage tail tube protein [Evansella halocellulosilytica]|uniref:phage tail tube protein n=1 Tax=Evansella halocellulosilytica TaxID=2011013 RepID=UPI000BB74282|nr:phage tail tube protein [Evansella halocellulosilytica]